MSRFLSFIKSVPDNDVAQDIASAVAMALLLVVATAWAIELTGAAKW